MRFRPSAWYWLVAVFFIVDRGLKALALRDASYGDGALAFTLFRNTGAAFSAPVDRLALAAISVAVFAAVAAILYRTARSGSPVQGPLTLLLAGGLSNVIDRVAFGFTVDYLIFFGLSAINLADLMIGVGAVFSVIASRRLRRP